MRRGAALALALGAVVVVTVVAGYNGGALIAIGVAMVVAVSVERGRACSGPLFRRRD